MSIRGKARLNLVVAATNVALERWLIVLDCEPFEPIGLTDPNRVGPPFLDGRTLFHQSILRPQLADTDPSCAAWVKSLINLRGVSPFNAAAASSMVSRLYGVSALRRA
jgi:hypothetical protein